MNRRRWAAAAVGTLVLAPYLARLAWPSLYADDVVRITQVRTWPLGELLRRPFNEHLAPAHGLITWLTWMLCGGRLTAAPAAFTVAALIPFPLALAALGWAVRRRTGEPSVALAAVALGGLSWLYLDVVANYSGSGFVWALAATLAALGAAGPTRRESWAAFGCAALAPAFSAIGLLAGPAGALGGLGLGVNGSAADAGGPRRLRAAAWPLAGTVLYLAIAASARYGETVARGLDRRVDLAVGALAAGRAVSNVLPLAAFGGKPAWARPLGWGDAALGGAAVLGLVLAAWRTGRWSLALAGLTLVAGGYALTYPFRYEGSSEWLLRVDRYHLFPHFGFVIWLAMLGALAARRWPGLRSAWLGPAAALLLLAVNGRVMIDRLRFYDFPDQGRVLAALEELEEVCRAEGITREQALAALEPIRTSWLHPERNGTTALALLGPTVEAARVPDDGVRARLLARLDAGAREALWGGMDVTRYLVAERPDAAPTASAVEVRSAGLRPIGAGRYVGRGGSAFVEFALAPSDLPARGLRLGVSLPGAGETKLPPVEVWWSDHGGDDWSETRRVTWRPAPGAASGVVPLEAMPHWGAPAGARRLRVAVRVPGTVAIDPPRLVR